MGAGWLCGGERWLGDEGEVESIAVVKATEQRRGVGRALLDAVMGVVQGGGRRGEIELEVRAGGDWRHGSCMRGRGI